jgi:hypothetical protein
VTIVATSRTAAPRGERGQTLPLLVVFLVVLLSLTGFVIDVGNWYWTRQQLQNAADAAALAGASQLPSGWTSARSASQSQYAANGQQSDTVSYTNTTSPSGSSGDSVTVTATRNDPTYFLGLLGIGSAKITVTARATIETLTSSKNVMPWGVMKNSFTYGQSVSLFGGLDQTGNFGAIDLPISPPSCTDGTGANNYRSNIDGSNTLCQVSVGMDLPTETGQMAGPTQQGLNSLIGSNTDTFSQVVQMVNGQAVILKQSPRLVLVPIVLNTDGTTNWPSGKKDIQVVGFAYFFISSYTSKTVTGQFVANVTDTTSGDGFGAYQSSSSQPTAAVLTQ